MNMYIIEDGDCIVTGDAKVIAKHEGCAVDTIWRHAKAGKPLPSGRMVYSLGNWASEWKKATKKIAAYIDENGNIPIVARENENQIQNKERGL